MFFAVADLEPAARLQYLDRQTTDPAIRAEVLRLVQHDKGSSTALGTPLASIAAKIEQSVPATDVKQVGPYRVIRELGRGGMGAVYEAERSDGEVKLRVAIKFVSRAVKNDFIVERFRRERQILADLNHPNICRMIDAGTAEDSSPYLVMEMIEGQTADAWAKGRSVREICELFRHVCAAVQHAHQHMVVHRDLKPANILVTEQGEPKLLDFGIAKLLDAAPVSLQNTIRAHTPDYASPEQIAGRPITAASDIYGLACVLYHLLTGKPPRRTRGQVMPEPAWTFRADVPKELDTILARAMQPEPAQRFATAREFGDELGRWLNQTPVRQTRIETPLKTKSSWTTTAGIAAAVVLAAAASFGWWRAERRLHALQAILDESNIAVANAPNAKAVAVALKQQWTARKSAGLDDTAAAIAIAEQLRNAGDYSAATAVLAESGASAEVSLEASRIAFDQGRLDEAASLAQRAGDSAEAFIQRALVDRHLGRLSEARKSAEQAVALAGPSQQRASDEFAQILADSGDLTQALKVEQSAAEASGDRTYLRRVGEILEASGERERAQQIYARVLTQPSGNSSPQSRAERLIDHLRAQPDGIEAQKQADALLAEFPDDRYAQLAHARVTAARGDRPKADGEYERLLEKSPKDAEILRDYATNRIALARTSPSACTQGTDRLKATPHPAVALLARQLQQVCNGQ